MDFGKFFGQYRRSFITLAAAATIATPLIIYFESSSSIGELAQSSQKLESRNPEIVGPPVLGGYSTENHSTSINIPVTPGISASPEKPIILSKPKSHLQIPKSTEAKVVLTKKESRMDDNSSHIKLPIPKYEVDVPIPPLQPPSVNGRVAVNQSTNSDSSTTWIDMSLKDVSGYRGVRVSFATDRQYEISDKKISFGSEPGNVSYGYCYVSIPPSHKIGAIESPSIYKLEFRENPEKHVMIQETKLQPYDEFIKDLSWLSSRSNSGNAFVFIHGFNVGFDDAAKRTAQIAYDLNFDGVPIFFSWPSRNSASLTAYEADERNIELSEGTIKRFLIDVLSDTQISNLFVIGHSMGTRGLAKAVGAIALENPEALKKMKAIILAAPDIDTELFKREIAPKLLRAERNITLYASSNDRALSASQRLHGYPRAGDSGTGLVLLKGMDTIDASNVDTSLLGHSYYGDVRTIIDDMHYLIQQSLPVDQRAGLSSIGREPNRYWFFKR